jgi:natural product biosynthesis luciferase-like monooxygenase protein
MQRDHLETDDSLALIALDEGGVRLRIGDLRLESIPVNQGTTQFDITLIMAEAGGEIHGSLQYNADLFEPESVRQIAERFITLSRSIATEPNRRILDIDLLPEAERRRMLVDWNDTEGDYERDLCIHALFERQVEKSPQSPALVFENRQLTYSEMNRRANRLARRLREFGVGPEVTVGLCAERSIELIEGILAILKAGGAFVSLDPALPKERLAFMFEDSGARLLLTQKRLADKLSAAATIYLDSDGAAKFAEGDSNLTAVATPGNLGYVMYTSGSTGKPKGVMVTHRNVVNFFAGMDERIGCGGQDALLAVSSISFDISVLELLWTLANGGKVILIDEQAARGRNGKARAGRSSRPMEFSLFYFASDEMGDGEKYRLLLEGAKFADRNGFAAVWTPERHFHQFGGLYPNPAVCGAALAVLTERIRIRAGSVVAPLHNPIRVAEEWSLVDNLSGGRAGIAFASGWHADDFVFFPENYPSRKEVMFRDIETIRKLWRGEPVEVQGGAGNEIAVSIYPKPFQKELPIWLTATGSPDTFIKAGEMGAGVLTHLLGQSLDEVAEKIQLYRESLARNGRDRESGHVTLMLHTFIGEDRGEVREIVRLPFTNYLRSSVGLIANLAKSLDLPLDLDRMSEEDMEALLAYAFDRYFEIGALFGTIETCGRLVEKLREIGVDEVAGLIDFGVDANTVLASLNNLKALKDLHSSPARMEDYSLAAQSLRHGASMMQCTPSMMSMLSLDERVMDSLKELKKLMLGGEALLPGLAKRVKAILPARMMNMYGPTETTIWSTSHEVSDAEATISIGRPIANTQIYILDVGLDPVPRGCIGEIHIGGLGVARGYFNQPGLSAERFIPDRFAAHRGALMYRTGDLGRYLPDGRLECVGRFDQQVKLRGFRIELGEIESALAGHKGVREAAVVMREDTPGDRRLVAYVATAQGTQVSASELLAYLRTKLPEYMAPSLFVDVKALPRSSNGKVDRKALPAPGASRPNLTVDYAPPRSRLEQVVASVWRQSLNLDKVGIHDNFFDLGGNSLLMAQAHSQLRSLIGRDFPLVKLIEHPTISSLAAYLAEERESGIAQSQNLDRARKQREGVRRQRQIIETKGGPR